MFVEPWIVYLVITVAAIALFSIAFLLLEPKAAGLRIRLENALREIEDLGRANEDLAAERRELIAANGRLTENRNRLSEKLVGAIESQTTWADHASASDLRAHQLEEAIRTYHNALGSPGGLDLEGVRQCLFDLLDLPRPSTMIVDGTARIDVHAGDLVLVKAPNVLRPEAAALITERLEALLPDDVHVAVVDAGLEVQVLGEDLVDRRRFLFGADDVLENLDPIDVVRDLGTFDVGDTIEVGTMQPGESAIFHVKRPIQPVVGDDSPSEGTGES